MTRVTRVAPLLLRGRISAGHGLIDVLAIAAFTLSSWLLLVVLAGVNTFLHRQVVPPAGFLRALGTAGGDGVQQLPFWTVLAACAGVLLVVPVLTLGAAAARMGALGRDQRLATLRLLGVTGGQVLALSALETMLTALVGTLAGLAGYLSTLPLWSAISFQASPLSAAEMMLPPLAVAGIVLLQVVLAGLSSVTGLMRLRISPLRVARRQPRPALKVWRFVLLPVVVVVWLAVAPLLNLQRQVVFGASVVVVALGVFMGVINLVGPWLLQLLGVALSRSGRPATLIAGRRMLADPKGVWRSVSGLAFVGFTGGALASVPALTSDQVDPLVRILADDLRTGTYLTVAIAFLVAATSTLLNQAAAVLDRRRELRQLGNLGVPVSLHHRIRVVEVIAPAALAALGSGGLAVFFLGLLPKVGSDHLGVLGFGSALLAGVALVWLAGEACRPLVRAAVS
ncbi:MAG TPA: FtsX-like permease family protein [Propionicimonas sp.]|uniref:FtsX-like permease family protein n=1 Tax=Propionicimonas sp. TaxID=1955623 RepID=UPI002F40DD9E